MRSIVFLLILITVIQTASAIPKSTSVIVETKIDASGIFYQKERIGYPYDIYEYMLASVKKMGYSSLRDYVLSKVPANIRGKVLYSEVMGKDFVLVIIETKYLTPEEIAALSGGLIKVSKEKGYIIFEDSSYVNQSNADDAWLHYYLEMPGEIVSTNAEIVHGNKAEWHLKGKDIGRIYAVAKLPRFPIPSISGFIVVVALGTALVIYLKRGYLYRN